MSEVQNAYAAARFIKVGAKPESDLDQFPIVRDVRTNLMWDRREFDSMTAKGMDAHIAKLNADKFGGFSDWRMPTITELLTLVDYTKFKPATDTQAFPNCNNGWYRSSTPYAESPGGCAWLVSGSSVAPSSAAQYGRGFVRAVRVSQ